MNTGKRRGFERCRLFPDLSRNWLFALYVVDCPRVAWLLADVPHPSSPPVAWFWRRALVCFPGDRFGALRVEGNCVFRLCVV